MKVFGQTLEEKVISILILIGGGVVVSLYFSEIIRKHLQEVTTTQPQQIPKPSEITSAKEEVKTPVVKIEVSLPASSCGVISSSDTVAQFNQGDIKKISKKPNSETLNEILITQDQKSTVTAKIHATQKETDQYQVKTATSNYNFEESGSPTMATKHYLLKEAGSCSSEQEELRIVIVKHKLMLYCYRGDLLVKSYPIAIGKNYGDKQKPNDKRTPEGDFYIVSIEDSKEWWHDFGDGRGPIKGVYGPWFLRLYTGSDTTKSKKTWTGIGIHGTHVPTSIGKMTTKGCIRMRNEDIEELRKLVKVGTRVSIVE